MTSELEETEQRRRTIATVLGRRPTTVRELTSLVSRIAGSVDEGTVRSDLDELGYETDDGTGMVEVPGPRRGHRVNAAVGIAAVALVGTLGLAGLLAARKPSTATRAAPVATTTTEPQGRPSARVVGGNGLDPALEDPRLQQDNFNRPGPLVDNFPGRGPWQVLSGAWSVVEDQLNGRDPAGEAGGLLAIDPGTADLRAQIEVHHPTNGAGIAFRIQDQDNYFAWTTVPTFATLALVQVTDGRSQVVFNVGQVSTGDGMPALGIHLEGSRVELLFDGAVATSYDELPPATGRERIGVTMADGGSTAVFDDFRLLVA